MKYAFHIHTPTSMQEISFYDWMVPRISLLRNRRGNLPMCRGIVSGQSMQKWARECRIPLEYLIWYWCVGVILCGPRDQNNPKFWNLTKQNLLTTILCCILSFISIIPSADLYQWSMIKLERESTQAQTWRSLARIQRAFQIRLKSCKTAKASVLSEKFSEWRLLQL